MDVDVVPVVRAIPQPRERLGIVGGQLLHRGIREDDAEAVGVGGSVAFVDRDLVRRVGALELDREVEPGGAAADDDDVHESGAAGRSARSRSCPAMTRRWISVVPS